MSKIKKIYLVKPKTKASATDLNEFDHGLEVEAPQRNFAKKNLNSRREKIRFFTGLIWCRGVEHLASDCSFSAFFKQCVLPVNDVNGIERGPSPPYACLKGVLNLWDGSPVLLSLPLVSLLLASPVSTDVLIFIPSPHLPQITMRSLTALVGLASLATALGNGYRTNGTCARVCACSAAAFDHSVANYVRPLLSSLPPSFTLPFSLLYTDNLQSRPGPNRTDECPFYFNTSPSSNTVSLYAYICRSNYFPPLSGIPFWPPTLLF